MLKIAVVAPTPTARVAIVGRVKLGRFASRRIVTINSLSINPALENMPTTVRPWNATAPACQSQVETGEASDMVGKMHVGGRRRQAGAGPLETCTSNVHTAETVWPS